MYLQAMQQCGANTQQVEQFIARLLSGYSHKELLRFNVEQLKPYTLEFVNTTFEIIHRGKLHEIAAAFTFGREDLIPDMFRSIVHDLDNNFPGKLKAFRYYLDRHIELDEEVHTPLALQMIEELCGDDTTKWQEAKQVAKLCLKARIKLWDGIEDSIKNRQIQIL
jgi:pyrroloquinoline quinone (PQQ) biosynthesis protein C